MGILRAMSGRAAAAALAAVITAMSCQGAVETTPPTEPEPPPSRCSVYNNKEDCCAAECGWMSPDGEFPGACFDEHEDCTLAARCPAPQRCYITFVGEWGECKPDYYDLDNSGVCVTTCPSGTIVQEREEQEACFFPPPWWPDAGTDADE